MTCPLYPLSQVASINPRFEAGKIEKEATISFVPMAAVSEVTGAVIREEERLLADVIKGFTPFLNGDILVAKITPCFENGKIALAQLSRDVGFGSTEFHVVRPLPHLLDTRYAYHFLRQPAVRQQGERRMTGSAGQRRVPKDFIEGLNIPLPSLTEQRRIAALLDEADALRHKRREVITKFDTLLQSVFLENFGDPVENSKAWEKATIADLVQDVSYGTSSLAGSEGEFPVPRMGNITYAGGWDFTNLKYIDLSNKEQHKYLVRRGDLLFNRTNSKELVGKTAVYRRAEPMAYAGYLIRVRPKPEHSSEYISAYLNSAHGKQVLRKMCKSIIGMANINASELKSIPILVPLSSFQKDYEKRAAAIYAMREDAEASLSQMEALFTTLQHQAFHSEPTDVTEAKLPKTPCLTLDF